MSPSFRASSWRPLVLLPVLAACAGDNFIPDPSGGAGAAGTSSGGSGAGAGGAASKGGNAGATASGGTSGNVAKGGGSGAGGATAGSAGEGGSDLGGNGGESGEGGAGDAGGGGSSSTGAGAGGSGAGTAGASGGGGVAGASVGGATSGGSAGAAGSAAGDGGAAGTTSAGAGGAAGGTAAGSGGAAGGTTAGSGGAAGSATAGSGGGAGTANAGAGGSAGAGGGCVIPTTPGQPESCPANEYCDASLGKCVSCADLTSIRFRAPVLRFTPAGGLGEISSPRPGRLSDTPIVLFSSRPPSGPSSDRQTHALTFDGTGTPTVQLLQKVTNGYGSDIGALLLPGGMTGADLLATKQAGEIASSNIRYALLDSHRGYTLADGTVVPASNNRHIHVVQTSLGATTGWGTLEALNGGTEDFSVAFASVAAAKRFYWTDVRGTPEITTLRTLVLGGKQSESVEVKVALAGCPAPAPIVDHGAWITSEGTRLFIQARCDKTSPSRIFVTTPAVDGTLPAFVEVPFDAYAPNADDTSPSLSSERCEMWFSRGGAIYSARRR